MVTPMRFSLPFYQVNLTDAGEQGDPAIADIGLGRYIVVWTELAGGPIGTAAGTDLVGQIFNPNGSRFGTEFAVNTSFQVDDEKNAALASRPGGGFVMVYEDTDANGTAIRVQSRDANGALAGGPTSIQADTNADVLFNPAVAMRPDGSYLVAYDRFVAADGSRDQVGRIVSAGGVVGAEFSIFDSADDAQRPDIDVLTNGNYVIVFQDADDATLTDYDPQFSIRDSTGASVTAGTIDSGGNTQGDVQVAALTGGGFVAVWTEANGDGNGTGIRARIYDNAGGAVAPAFTASWSTVDDQNEPDVVALNDGGFLVSWHEADDGNVNTNRFDVTGTSFFPLHGGLGLGSTNAHPTVAGLSDGRIILVTERTAGDNDIGAIIFAIDTETDDFNFDLHSDILWRNDNGTVATWEMNGAEIANMTGFGVQPEDWHIQGTGDFGGNGKSDMLWRQDSGTVGIWHMDGATVISTHTFDNAPPDWHIEGTGDFNGDGRTDILWRQDGGLVGTWHMNSSATVLSTPTFGTQPLDWHIEGTGDFNGDGMTDMLWRQDGGNIGTWHMNGAQVISTQVFANSPNDWHIEGTGDFNGDGNDDILWRHDSGLVGTWHMDGATVLSTQAFANAPLDWHIMGAGDYNGDGNDDILWRQDSGLVGTWHMNGATVLSTPVFGPVANAWHIMGNEFELI